MLNGLVVKLIKWMEKPVVAMGFITTIGAVLRIYNLGVKSLWVDEALLFQFANGDLEHVLRYNALYNSYPPLFAILLRAMLFIGDSEPVLRAVPCLAGIASIPVMYYLAKKFVSYPFALFAALLVALAPNQIMYSQQAVVYSTTFLLAEIIFIIFLRFLEKSTWQNFLFLSSIIFVSIFMQYGLAVLVLSVNIVFFIRVRKLHQPVRAAALWSFAQVIGLIAAYAVYHLSIKHQFASGGFGADYMRLGYWDGMIQHLLRMVILNTADIIGFAFPAAYLLTGFVIFGIIGIIRDRSPMKAISLMMLGIPLATTFIFALARLYPYMGARQTIFLLPMIYVFAAIGTAFLFSIKRIRYILVVPMAVLIFQGAGETAGYLESEGVENMRPVIATLASSIARDDLIYVYYGAVPAFEYYFRGNDHPWIKSVESRQAPEKYFQQLSGILAQNKRIWIVISHSSHSEGQMIIEYVAGLRELKTVHQEKGAYLFLAYYSR